MLLLEWSPFQKGFSLRVSQTWSHESCPPFRNGGKSTECISFPLYNVNNNNNKTIYAHLTVQNKMLFLPGDYLQNQQCFDPMGCEPCNLTKPSCVGLPDGNNTFPGRAGDYIICSMERTVGVESCESGMYDENTRKCGLDMCKRNSLYCCALLTLQVEA